ncbi:MAG: hypothetical protein OWQ57_08450, partial [Sulfobacillus sp.]|nr:hypothetical protein [Sulfobacillus sp.]
MKKRLGDFLRSAVTESLPVAARVSTETLVLSFGGPPVVASGAGEVAERMADAVIRSFHPSNVALEPGPAVVVAPIPEESRMSPGFFLYTLKTVPDGDGWRVLPNEVDRVYPHYVADGRLAQWIGQRLAGKDGTFDVLDAIHPGTSAQIAWSLWIDQRARTTFSDDWYYRETMYYIGSVESSSGTGYYLWNRGVTNHGFTYSVWTGEAMSDRE